MAVLSARCVDVHTIQILLSRPSLFHRPNATYLPSQTTTITPTFLRRNYVAEARTTIPSKKSKSQPAKPHIQKLRHPAITTPNRAPQNPAPQAPLLPRNSPSLLHSTLSARPSPTLLYLAPTSSIYPLTCLSVSLFAFAYGGYNLHDAYLVPHPGLWWVVPHMMAGVSIFMLGTGAWVGLGARRLVGVLSAVPMPRGKERDLMLRFEERKVLSFLPGKGRAFEVLLGDVELTTPVTPVAMGPQTEEEKRRGVETRVSRQRQERRRVVGRQEVTERSLWFVLTSPVRSLLRVGSLGIGRVVGRDGFVGLNVRGKGSWKVDAREGWLLDDGLALDRLLKVR